MQMELADWAIDLKDTATVLGVLDIWHMHYLPALLDGAPLALPIGAQWPDQYIHAAYFEYDPAQRVNAARAGLIAWAITRLNPSSWPVIAAALHARRAAKT